jgi:hypothetical protein
MSAAAEPLAERTDTDGVPLSTVGAEVAAEREAQGLPRKITDPRALAQVARLVLDSTQQDARPA